jgi:hypothetical protein
MEKTSIILRQSIEKIDCMLHFTNKKRAFLNFIIYLAPIEDFPLPIDIFVNLTTKKQGRQLDKKRKIGNILI